MPGPTQAKITDAQRKAAIARLDAAMNQQTLEIEEIDKNLDEYKELKSLLVDLPEKMTHEVCCPVGKLAFFPGKLTNTNQILTLVGDDYFIERTVKNTLPTIKNRTDLLNAKRLEVDKQLDKIRTMDAEIPDLHHGQQQR